MAGRYDIVNDIIEIAKPTKSDARWAVSVKMAIELDKIPPIIYAIMKNTETVATNVSLRMAFLLLSLI